MHWLNRLILILYCKKTYQIKQIQANKVVKTINFPSPGLDGATISLGQYTSSAAGPGACSSTGPVMMSRRPPLVSRLPMA